MHSNFASVYFSRKTGLTKNTFLLQTYSVVQVIYCEFVNILGGKASLKKEYL